MVMVMGTGLVEAQEGVREEEEVEVWAAWLRGWLRTR